jgi:hypothetical protein
MAAFLTAVAFAISGCASKREHAYNYAPEDALDFDAGDAANPKPHVDASARTDASYSDDDGSVFVTGPDCAQAAAAKSYVGCDYWPTVVGNVVTDVFDFAVVVANAGAVLADVTVTGPNGVNRRTTVAAHGLATIYLPWVSDLKGPDSCIVANPTYPSVFAPNGAYHLVSSRPVTVYQFSPIEYQSGGGPPGKSWAGCDVCGDPCLSYTNDASLLLPSTAMTGNYWIPGLPSWSLYPAYFAVTGTVNATTVKVKVARDGAVAKGDTIAATAANGVLSFTVNQGDVAEVYATPGGDLSGSQISADKPVQVITGIPCTNVPFDRYSCDHVEESVLPAETLGQHYVVTQPTAPDGTPKGHLVRMYGAADRTTLTGAPASCGATLDAGQVIDCGIVTADFEVTGDKPFAVSSFMQARSVVDSEKGEQAAGDPSQSQMIAVEQYRDAYVFLAPLDYDENFIDVVAPTGTPIFLDDRQITAAFKPIGKGGFGAARVKLGAGNAGAHSIFAAQPFGVQVIGYGVATSYQYPAGLDLRGIAAPPAPIN